jgi:hypothetical protein
MLHSNRADEHFRGNTEALVDPADHLKRPPALAGGDFPSVSFENFVKGSTFRIAPINEPPSRDFSLALGSPPL